LSRNFWYTAYRLYAFMIRPDRFVPTSGRGELPGHLAIPPTRPDTVLYDQTR